jgi:fatty acid desaturase
MAPRALRQLVADLQRRHAPTYWLDFLASSGAGWGALVCATRVPLASLAGASCVTISAFGLYRAALFTHELVHMPRGAVPWFQTAWNIACGVPLLVPSFAYEMHSEHHHPSSYGTASDGEYQSFAAQPRWRAALWVATSFVALPALIARFLVLAPLGCCFPPFRRILLERASALIIDPEYRRSLPPGRTPPHWAWQEAACFGWLAILVVCLLFRVVPMVVVSRAYVVITAVMFANSIRVLAAHRYRSDGRPMTVAQQVLDSNNFPHGLAALWAPVGLRFHAVHHLFPNLPYHALGEAYRRVMARIPEDSLFRSTSSPSLLAALDESIGRRRVVERHVK